ETRAAVLSGFQVVNGHVTATSDGAGVSIYGASPTISGNWIQDNVGCEGGGLLANGGSSARIVDNHFIGNSACSGGGGMLLDSTNGAIVSGNVIEHNSAAWGGGIFAGGAGSARIERNRIGGNRAETEGGGVNSSLSNLVFRDNVVFNNHNGGVQIDQYDR